jgi:hypothetical protein
MPDCKGQWDPDETEGRGYSVLIVNMFHYDSDDDYTISGFPTLELAREYARRRVRDSLEELREPGMTQAELRKRWMTFGEDAVVIGGDYAGGRELDFLIDNPATHEERDWKAIDKMRRAP